MNTTGNAQLDSKLLQLIEALTQSYVNFGNVTQVSLSEQGLDPIPVDRRTQISFELRKGKRYSKLVVSTRGAKSIHAFVENETGFLYKPAGINAPAKHVRYKLLDECSFSECLKRADWSGSYLYIR